MISVICTVLNEGDSIRRLLDSLAAQTRPPDEIVIVDGGSRDATVPTLHAYAKMMPLRVIVMPGCNISQGRNVAIRQSRGDIIAATDAGVILQPDWLDRLVQPFDANADLAVTAGFFRADSYTPFEIALGAATLPAVDEIDGETFLPSSRSIAFRRSAWEQVGGYPEWLDYCEDLVFDLRLRACDAPQTFVPDAVAHFRPRPSYSAYFKQYFRYARGDGKADLWRKRHAIRYATYLIAVPILGVGMLRGRALTRIVSWVGLLIGAAIYLRKPYQRLPQRITDAERTGRITATPLLWINTLVQTPVVRVVGDVAKMVGYPVGWWWRWQHRPEDWRRVE